MTRYDNEDNAKAEVKRLTVDTLPNYFCPLTGKDCNAKCVCIGQPYMRGNQYGNTYKQDTEWSVWSWYCDNPMLVREE